MTNKEKWQWYNNTFVPTLNKALNKAQEKKVGEFNATNGIYYEVWIDLEERLDRWFDYMYNWTNLAVGCISQWMLRRDKWYWSESYVESLNKAMANGATAEEALTKVSNDSLK